MDEPRKYQAEVTAERLAAIHGPLTRALMVQNNRLGTRMDTSKLYPALRVIGLSLCALGIIVALVMFATGPRDPSFTLSMLAFFVALTPVFAFTPWLRNRVRGWSRRVASRMLVRTAGRTLAAWAKQLPYTVDYEIDGTTLVARCEKLALDSRTALGSYGLALVDRDVLFTFKRRNSLQAARMLFVPTDADREALRAAFERAGVPVEPVPTERPQGY